MTVRIAITVLVLALTAVACGNTAKKDASGLRDRIKVGGSFGSRPTIDFSAPLRLTRTASWTLARGNGDTVGPEATTILGLTLADGRTGRTVISTRDQGQHPLEVQLGDQLFPALSQALVGKSADSRVVIASVSDDAYGEKGAPQIGIKGGDPVVMVADIMSTDPTTVLKAPTGTALEPPADAPTIRLENGEPAGFDFKKLPRPKTFRAVLLRQGTGSKVEDPDRIAADYVGQVWNARQPFDNTFPKEPARFSIGLGRVIKAWDQGLSGLREGARVMLLCPPSAAYGSSARPGIPANSTLVFVVDVLGVG